MSEEGQVTDEGEGTGESQGDGEDQGTLLGGDGQVKDNGEGQGDGEGAAGEGEGEGSGEGEIPETYEFNMPEGMELDQALADAAQPVFKELELNQDQADKLTGLLVQQRQAEADASAEAFVKQLDDWGQELQKDETFGGDNFKANSDQTFQFIEATVPDDLKPLLLGPDGLFDQTGIGQHPALVKYFFHLSQKFPVKEDDPGSGDGDSGKGESPEARLYPNEAKKTG